MDEIKAFFEKANKFLRSARLLIDNEDYDSAVSRIYYAMFYSVEAILIKENFRPKSHNGVITLFNREYIKTGRISAIYGKQLSQMQRTRELGDYSLNVKYNISSLEKMYDDGVKFVNHLVGFERTM